MEKTQHGQLQETPRQAGFSLIELIVVITIIGILASVVVVNVSGRDDQAKQAQAKSEVRGLSDAAQMFKLDHGFWPESIDELLNPPELDGAPSNPYMEQRPRDPWTKEDYIFEPDDRGVYVASFGADMEEGGEGINSDISNRDQNN